ncbi:LLM class flavin-dependent oxidoreductase [Streptacidiphilus rugosus]|uniref:LLM class flavin-dependent oxidoreductase n=1 Tax=Streptacidiphilus rugosus TaxID=405783 RepID=UPI000A03B2EB
MATNTTWSEYSFKPCPYYCPHKGGCPHGTDSEAVDASTTLHDTVHLAQAAEQLGFHRFWVAEHHSVPGILGGCSSSEGSC